MTFTETYSFEEPHIQPAPPHGQWGTGDTSSMLNISKTSMRREDIVYMWYRRDFSTKMRDLFNKAAETVSHRLHGKYPLYVYSNTSRPEDTLDEDGAKRSKITLCTLEFNSASERKQAQEQLKAADVHHVCDMNNAGKIGQLLKPQNL